MYYIYKITNLINLKVYIGLTTQTVEVRWLQHVSGSKNAKGGIDAAIKKYGPQNFIIEQIDTASSIDELNKKEIYYIAYYHSWVHDPESNGYNITLGGGGILGYHHTPESAYKCGSSFRGKHRIKTPGQIEKWKESHKNYKPTEETKLKTSNSLKKAYAEGRRIPNGKGVGGRGIMSEKEKIFNSQNQIGKKNMHNDELKINLVVWADEINTFIKNGWDYKFIKDYTKLSRNEARNLGLIN